MPCAAQERRLFRPGVFGRGRQNEYVVYAQQYHTAPSTSIITSQALRLAANSSAAVAVGVVASRQVMLYKPAGQIHQAACSHYLGNVVESSLPAYVAGLLRGG